MNLKELLKLPEMRGVSDLDAPETTLLHAEIIKKKPFLRRLYRDFYNEFKSTLNTDEKDGLIVELGSGGGNIKEIMPTVITSDINKLPIVDMHFSALKMPFDDRAVSALFLINVLHHIHDSRLFFKEVQRCLKPGGKAVMVEPSGTPWNRFMYRHFHHETFDAGGGWGFDEGGPLSSANPAIPWIIFHRDMQKFKKEFPNLKVNRLKNHTPFGYVISGGLTARQLLPSFTYNMIKGIERALEPFNDYIGMYLTVELEKVG